MKVLPALLIVGLFGLNVPVSGLQAQDPPQQPKELTFEGCLVKGEAENALVLRNAYAVGGGIAGTGLQFRVIPDNEGVVLHTHLTHVVRVTGPMEGAIPAAGRTVPERELPLIRVRTVSMMSNECLEP